MRITGGELRGRRLSESKSDAIRPMRDQVRAALFSILGGGVEGSRFLDLFAGTGSVGIEALSRGAAHATFVDKSPDALTIIRANLRELAIESRADVIADDVFQAIEALSKTGPFFDFIFVGPPYGKMLADQALQELGDSLIVGPNTIIFVEVFKKEVLANQYKKLKKTDERLYGDNLVVFYQREESPS